MALLYLYRNDPWSARAYAERALRCDPEHQAARDAFVAAEREISKEELFLSYEADAAGDSILPRSLKVAFAAHLLYPPVGGAEISAMNVLRTFAKKGHDVLGVCFGNDASVSEMNVQGVKIARIPNAGYLSSILRRFSPDVVLTQLELSPDVVSLCAELGVPSVLFVRSHEHYCAYPMRMEGCTFDCPACRPAELRSWFEKSARAFRDADLVVCNSKYMRRNVKRFFGRWATYVYPLVNARRVQVEHRLPTYVTMVRPLLHKGIDVFLEIAGSLPSTRFLIAGEPVPEAVPPNVRCMGRVDPRIFLSLTRILLVPSQWPEPFGRVAVEALANGIPVIASRSGGLPEAVGDAGILVEDYANPTAWTATLFGLENDADLLAELSLRGTRRFGVLSDAVQWLKLEYELSQLLDTGTGAAEQRDAGAPHGPHRLERRRAL